jgi:hypothetical protein
MTGGKMERRRKESLTTEQIVSRLMQAVGAKYMKDLEALMGLKSGIVSAWIRRNAHPWELVEFCYQNDISVDKILFPDKKMECAIRLTTPTGQLVFTTGEIRMETV